LSAKISLNGTWQLRWNDGQRGGFVNRVLGPNPDTVGMLAATVPGEIHLDLMAAGLLEEPATGLNCLAARWVEETQWYYRRTFDAPALAPGERAFLVFNTLDLAATVYLNDKEAGHHANAFYPCVLDVTDLLVADENVLVVAIEAGLFSVADRQGSGYGMAPDSTMNKRNWLRKTQSSFGWDWSTRLLNVGIYGDVTLEICAGVRVAQSVVLAEMSPDLSTGFVTGRVIVQGLTDATQHGTLTVTVEAPHPAAHIQAVQEVAIGPGENRLDLRVPVEAPALWWPVGHGEQPLYTVTVSLSVNGEPISNEPRRVGFRRVEITQSPHPAGGRYFILEVNGKPIFCKGGDFVPADMILARLDRLRYATLVDRALEANCNMLRVWGGGLYESDDLYEVCDEAGVLVWQEFIFACAKYPVQDAAWLADVKQEATYQARRLAHHASLVVWCGNNEMEWGAYNWGFEKGVAHPDYALFHLVLPLILQQEDGTRYYQPSSPYSPDLAEPNRDDVGDQHPWSVGFLDTDFRKYREMICRFPNEGGILGPNALPTVLACLPKGQQHPHSLAWEMHDNGIAFAGDRSATDAMLEQWVGRSIMDMTIEDYVYWGGLVQGEGLAEYIRNFRRRMFSSASAIFWMYNDCWPTVRSWTIVDYYLRRTPAFYPVKRAFAPLAVALAVEDEMVRVFGINEGADWEGELRCGLCALAGGYPVDTRQRVSLPANTSTCLAEFPLARWRDLGETTHVAFALLGGAGGEVARDVLILPFFKEMAWPQPHVTVRREDGRAVFESDTFAWRVCLDLSGDHALPDNFFDVLPGVPTVLEWPSESVDPHVVRVGNI
jgi:beta-mannosidase